jgi:hypothetical protein
MRIGAAMTTRVATMLPSDSHADASYSLLIESAHVCSSRIGRQARKDIPADILHREVRSRPTKPDYGPLSMKWWCTRLAARNGWIA